MPTFRRLVDRVGRASVETSLFLAAALLVARIILLLTRGGTQEWQ